MLDIVYPVRPGDTNEELRFSLRSLAKFYPDHGTVWIVGHKPAWLTGVEVIPGGNPSRSAQTNVYQNVLLACRHSGLPDQFVIFNDDFFLTEPVTEFPDTYRSTLQEHLNLPRLRTTPKSWWRDSLLTTQVCLQAVGYENPLSYELHLPMPVVKDKMRATLEHFASVTPQNPPQWRTLYGNLHVTGAVKTEDSKVFRPGKVRRPVHSTTDQSWRHYRTAFAKMFPTPSRFESAGTQVRRRA